MFSPRASSASPPRVPDRHRKQNLQPHQYVSHAHRRRHIHVEEGVAVRSPYKICPPMCVSLPIDGVSPLTHATQRADDLHFLPPCLPRHEGRFSPDDKFSRHRVTIKKRYGRSPAFFVLSSDFRQPERAVSLTEFGILCTVFGAWLRSPADAA